MNKDQIKSGIAAMREELLKLSHDIHANPEVNFQEFKSSALIVGMLKKHNIEVKQPYCDLPTSFRAEVSSSRKGPKIFILAEYDALPLIGHACGHNVISTTAVGAFLGLAPLMEELGGTLVLLGTPAEEGGGGKIVLLERGAFDDADFTLMMHPSTGPSLLGRPARAACHFYVDFHGKATHSSDPTRGINALSAARAYFDLVDIIRPAFQPSYNANGVIKQGGKAGNIICDYAETEYSLRSNTLLELKDLIARVENCAKAAAMATGTELEIKCSPLYAERYSNDPMDRLFEANMTELGEKTAWPTEAKQYGSTDAGNVSIAVPSIHEYISLSETPVNGHSAAFAELSMSPRADEVCISGAQALAMTAFDLFTKEEEQKKARAYFDRQIPVEYKKGAIK